MEPAIGLQKRGTTRRLRLLILGFRGRHAVSTIIGGLIILSLILTALGTMVAVSQQYDQYQQTINKMGQYESKKFSENLVINSPGLSIITSTTISGWGSSCTTTYNCYNMSLSNLGGVGVQIMRIYINSTGPLGSGCSYSASSLHPQPCVLNPTSTIAPYAFNQASQFLNPGEVNHSVLLALPKAVTLPSLYYSQNTILIATSRGNVFSFQWPFPIQIFGGQSQSAFSTGILKVAYQDTSADGTGKCSGTYGTNGLLTYGCDSSHDYNGASGNTSPNAPYCHNEPEKSYAAPTNYAEKLTGVNYAGVSSSTLYFVNPWITLPILESARTDEETLSGNGGCTANCPTTQLYIYLNITNTGNAPYTVAGGTLDLTFSGSNHIDGNLIGIYYNATGTGQFYTASSTQTQTVAMGKSFYAIFKVTLLQLDLSYLTSSSMFWGSLSLTDNLESTGFVGGVGLSSGLWIRISC